MKNDHQYQFMRKEESVLALLLILGLAVCGELFYASVLPVLLFPLLYGGYKRLCLSFFVRWQQRQMLLQFKDLLFSLSASFAAGRHMLEAMKEAEEYLKEIYGADSLLERELLTMIRTIEETGASDLEVLTKFAKKTRLEDIETFVEVYGACRETGGDMVSAVDKAARVIGDKIEIEAEIQLAASQKKLEGRIIAVMPCIMILFLRICSPAYLEIMYVSSSGKLIMTVALLLNIAAFYWMERMTDIEI